MFRAGMFLALAMLSGADPAAAKERDVSSAIPKDHAGVDWLSCEGKPTWTGLVKDGKQIGAFNTETHEYYALDPLTGAWVKGAERVYHREDATAAIQLVNNPGVDWKRTQAEPSGYKIGGRPVTESAAFAALKPSPKLPDDSALPSLTLIGTVEECRAVEDEIARNPALRALRSTFLVQSYRPGDAMVSRYGFVSGGQPTIYFTDPAGKVVWRSDGDPGASVLGDAVAAGVEQCCPPRKPHPDYEPAKDPPPERVIKRAAAASWAWWIAGALGLVVVGLVAVAGLVSILGIAYSLLRRPAPRPAAPAAPVAPAAPAAQ